jgi:DNA-nicking Smr family endonuclease
MRRCGEHDRDGKGMAKKKKPKHKSGAIPGEADDVTSHAEGSGEGARPDPPAARPKPVAPVATSLRDLLKGVEPAPPPSKNDVAKKGAKKSATPPRAADGSTRRSTVDRSGPTSSAHAARPSETLRGDDRIAFLDALAGVRPMSGRQPTRIGGVAPPPAPPRPEEVNRDHVARERLTALVAGGVRFDVHREDGWTEGLRRDAKPAILQALRKATVPNEATLDLHGARAAEAEDRVARFVRSAHRAGMRRVLLIHGRGNHSEGHAVLADVVVKCLTEGGGAPFTVGFVTAPPSLGGSGALLVELLRR